MIDVTQDKHVPIKVSWGVLAFVVCSIFALGGYVMSQDNSTKENRFEIERIHSKEDVVSESLASIDKRLSRIEYLLEDKYKHKGN